MCFVVTELFFLVVGIWLIISGNTSNTLFQFSFGKGNYQLTAGQTRLLGLLLSSPIPTILGVTFALQLFFPANKTEQIAFIFEVVYDLLVAILSVIISRKNRRSTP
jgi:hypothetical protein